MNRAPWILLLLLLAPLASAHGAPPPRSYESRLLGDCNDDWFGSDVASRDGYDVHALDVREMYADTNSITFRTIMNGEGPASLTVNLESTAGSKSLTWTTQGSTWSGIGAITTEDLQDNGRFALEATVPLTGIGLSVGDRLTDFSVAIDLDGRSGDRIPGNDRQLPGACDTSDAPTEYKAAGYDIEGPVQYARFPARDAGDCRTGSFEPQALKVGERKLVDLVFCNPLDDNQQFTLTIVDDAGLDASFHQPGSDRYTPTATTALKADAGTLIHLALTPSTASTGTVKVALETSLGGRIVGSMPFEASAAGTSTPTTSTTSTTTSGNESTPAVSPLALIALMAVVAWRRR